MAARTLTMENFVKLEQTEKYFKQNLPDLTYTEI
jgi:hypothetical protein